jgi:peptidoglycan/xylan/chitin deacetylase (PgdA/CDA1 family)
MRVSPQHFAEQMEVLHRYTNPMPLDAAVWGLQDGNLPRRTVCVTFDDGYLDVLNDAKPILEKYQIPATVFLVTGSLGRSFWWDDLEECLLQSENLPGHLCLNLHGRSYEWSFRDDSRERRLHENILSILDFLRPLAEDERCPLLKQIQDWAGIDLGNEQMNRAMTPDEIIEIVRSGLIDIGSHSVTHPILAKIPVSAQRVEVQESKSTLERIVNRPLTSFSYPNGSSSQEVHSIVQGAGYLYACGSYKDVASRNSDPYQLPRIWIPDVSGDRFSSMLKKWL